MVRIYPDNNELLTQKIMSYCSVVSDSSNPMDYTVYRIFQARILEWVAFPFSRGSSQSRNWTQVSNPGLLHYRQILYQLSYQRSPFIFYLQPLLTQMICLYFFFIFYVYNYIVWDNDNFISAFVILNLISSSF